METTWRQAECSHFGSLKGDLEEGPQGEKNQQVINGGGSLSLQVFEKFVILGMGGYVLPAHSVSLIE